MKISFGAGLTRRSRRVLARTESGEGACACTLLGQLSTKMKERMSWIDIVTKEQAEGRLRALYESVAGPGGKVDNVLQVHSLRPHTLEAHMALYKSVLHHSGNKLPKWLLETIGVYVSLLNGCTYCVEHHFAGLGRLLKNDDRLQQVRHALE